MSPSSRRSGSVPQTLWVRTKPSDPIARARPTRADLSGQLWSARLPPAILHEVSMRRIGLAVVLIVSLMVASLAVEAQQAGKVARIGILWAYSPPAASSFAQAFREGLGELGYGEGKRVSRDNLDVMVTASTPAVQAAEQATKTIPIVMTLVSDPVEDGVVASLA